MNNNIPSINGDSLTSSGDELRGESNFPHSITSVAQRDEAINNNNNNTSSLSTTSGFGNGDIIDRHELEKMIAERNKARSERKRCRERQVRFQMKKVVMGRKKIVRVRTKNPRRMEMEVILR